MTRTRYGFTVVELAIALVIGAILTSIAISAFQGPRSRLAVRGARTMYATLHQKARARSVELGETVILVVDTVGDSVFLFSPSTGISDVTRFASQNNVDLRSPYNAFIMCMTPRGYADYNCGSYGGFVTATSATRLRLEFWQNADSASVWILPMGQLVGM